MDQESKLSLEEQAKIAAEIAEKLPAKFQERAFEMILESLLSTKQMKKEIITEQKEDSTAHKVDKPVIIPIDVRAFLQQYSIPEEKLTKLFLLHDGQIRSLYKITTTKKAKAQIQIALLTGLEHALFGGKFEFGFEEVRQKCKDHKCLDMANFSSVFKTNQKFFKDMKDKEHVELSPDGKTELSEIIIEMTK